MRTTLLLTPLISLLLTNAPLWAQEVSRTQAPLASSSKKMSANTKLEIYEDTTEYNQKIFNIETGKTEDKYQTRSVYRDLSLNFNLPLNEEVGFSLKLPYKNRITEIYSKQNKFSPQFLVQEGIGDPVFNLNYKYFRTTDIEYKLELEIQASDDQPIFKNISTNTTKVSANHQLGYATILLGAEQHLETPFTIGGGLETTQYLPRNKKSSSNYIHPLAGNAFLKYLHNDELLFKLGIIEEITNSYGDELSSEKTKAYLASSYTYEKDLKTEIKLAVTDSSSPISDGNEYGKTLSMNFNIGYTF